MPDIHHHASLILFYASASGTGSREPNRFAFRPFGFDPLRITTGLRPPAVKTKASAAFAAVHDGLSPLIGAGLVWLLAQHAKQAWDASRNVYRRGGTGIPSSIFVRVVQLEKAEGAVLVRRGSSNL